MTGMLKIKYFFILLLSVIFSLSTVYAEGQGGSSSIDRGSFPSQELVGLFQKGDQFFGFKKVEGPNYYGPDKLFDHINGGAELFLAYGFLELLVVEFTRGQDQANRVTLEIYNMGTLENAFGIFKTEAGDEVCQLPGGAEGRMGDGLLQFYKGKFYVKVFLPPKSEAYPRAVKEIAKAVETRIKGDFSHPPFFNLFPMKNLVKGSENYTSKDFLGQPFFKGIASAQFKQGGKVYTVFISIKPDREGAENGLQKYRKYLINEKAYRDELKGGMRGFIGNDPYYGFCSISVIRERIVGVLGNLKDAISVLKIIKEGK